MTTPRGIIIGATIEIMKYRRRQFAPRDTAKIHDVIAVRNFHESRIARIDAGSFCAANIALLVQQPTGNR